MCKEKNILCLSPRDETDAMSVYDLVALGHYVGLGDNIILYICSPGINSYIRC